MTHGSIPIIIPSSPPFSSLFCPPKHCLFLQLSVYHVRLIELRLINWCQSCSKELGMLPSSFVKISSDFRGVMTQKSVALFTPILVNRLATNLNPAKSLQISGISHPNLLNFIIVFLALSAYFLRILTLST